MSPKNEFNVVLLPEGEVADFAFEASAAARGLAELTTQLHPGGSLPHLTLHQCPVLASVDELYDALCEVLEGYGEITVTMLPRLSRFGQTGGVFWDAEKSDTLIDLHYTVMEVMDDRRHGYILELHAPFLYTEGLIDEAERDALVCYGNPLAGKDMVRPHITLASARHAGNVDELVELLPQHVDLSKMSFTCDSVHITGLGEFGTCPGSLREVSLL